MCYVFIFLGANDNYPLCIITAIFLFFYCQSKPPELAAFLWAAKVSSEICWGPEKWGIPTYNSHLASACIAILRTLCAVRFIVGKLIQT